jgi:hypothetical protein
VNPLKNHRETSFPFGTPPRLAVIAFSILIWGLGEGLFIFFFPLALSSGFNLYVARERKQVVPAAGD